MPFNDVPVPNPFIIHRFSIPLDLYWDESQFFSGETHPEYEIVHLLDGEVECAEEGRVYHLRAGDMLLHAPDEFHNIRSFNHTCPHFRVFSFIARGKLPSTLTDGVLSLNAEEQQGHSRIFKALTDIYERRVTDDYSIFKLSMELISFLIGISENHTPKANYSQTRPAKEYHLVVSTMQKKLYETCTLQDFSEMCSISTSYMKDLFNRYAGISPKMYYSRMRCDEAIKLLNQGLCVQEVSDRMGFSSPNYFSVFFKNIMGTSPARYIKQNQTL